MTSLFSSFDLNLFFYSTIFFLFLMFIYFINIFHEDSKLSLMNFAFTYLETFYLSLKPNKFNKSTILIFLSIFTMLLLANMASVFPYIFAVSSQLSYVFLFSFMVWSSFIIFSINMNFQGFISHLTPEGTPMILTPLLFIIELVSNTIRPITLMVRLSANILAGHLLMILLSKLVFIYNFTFLFYILLNSIELFVALIQSYIFCTMSCLYFSEVE